MKIFYRLIQKSTNKESGSINIPKEIFDLWMSRGYEHVRVFLEDNDSLTITPL